MSVAQVHAARPPHPPSRAPPALSGPRLEPWRRLCGFLKESDKQGVMGLAAFKVSRAGRLLRAALPSEKGAGGRGGNGRGSWLLGAVKVASERWWRAYRFDVCRA